MFIRLGILVAVGVVAAVVLRSVWVAVATVGMVAFWSILIWLAHRKQPSSGT